FTFYNTERKKDMYMLGKKFYKYNVGKPNFRGVFTKHFPLDMVEYKKRKFAALKMREKAAFDTEEERLVMNLLKERIFSLDSVTHEVKRELLGMKEQTYYYNLRKWKQQKAFEA
ncbi:unnamed protein product, partial [marine sediment metagenome]